MEYLGEVTALQAYMIHNVLDGNGIDIVGFYIGFGLPYMLEEDGLALFLVIALETVGLGNIRKNGVYKGLDRKVIAEACRGQLFRQSLNVFRYGVLGV